MSSTEATRILRSTDFTKRNDIIQALKELKVRQGDPGLNLNEADYNRLLRIVGSYMPLDIIPAPAASLDDWTKAAERLQNYHYDGRQEALGQRLSGLDILRSCHDSHRS